MYSWVQWCCTVRVSHEEERKADVEVEGGTLACDHCEVASKCQALLTRPARSLDFKSEVWMSIHSMM